MKNLRIKGSGAYCCLPGNIGRQNCSKILPVEYLRHVGLWCQVQPTNTRHIYCILFSRDIKSKYLLLNSIAREFWRLLFIEIKVHQRLGKMLSLQLSLFLFKYVYQSQEENVIKEVCILPSYQLLYGSQRAFSSTADSNPWSPNVESQGFYPLGQCLCQNVMSAYYLMLIHLYFIVKSPPKSSTTWTDKRSSYNNSNIFHLYYEVKFQTEMYW